MDFIKKNLNLIIIYLLIIVLFIGGTYFAVKWKKDKIEIDYGLAVKTANKVEKASGTDIYKPFESQRLTIKENEKNENGVDITRITISGLKDNKIQKAIQTEINDEIDAIKRQIIDLKCTKCKNKINVSVEANFSNVLSIIISGYSLLQNDEYSNYIEEYSKSLNYDLTTGNFIQLAELFTDEQSAYDLILKAVYESISIKYRFEHFNEDNFKPDYSKVEDEVLQIMQDFKNNKLNFNFGSNGFSVYSTLTKENNTYGLFYGNLDKIAIFHRFDTKNSIFEKNAEKVIIQPSSYLTFNLSDNEYFGLVNKNVFLVSLLYQEDVPKKMFGIFKKYQDDLVAKYKNSVIYTYSDLEENSVYELYGLNAYTVVYTPKSNYSFEKLWKHYIDYTLNPLNFGGAMVELEESKNYSIIYLDDNKVYDKNLKELKFEDVIDQSNEDFKELIKSQVNFLEYQNTATDEFLESLYPTLTYSITYNSLVVTFPQSAEEKRNGSYTKVNIGFDDIWEQLLKI